MAENSDPRIYFAAERTLLAWLRTAIAVIGLGFLVARFGVFLMLVRGQNPVNDQRTASMIGIAFVFLGAVMAGGAAIQHFRFSRTLSGHERPGRYSMTFSLCVAVLATASAVVLCVYLASSTQSAQ
ncbi:MAG: DUF202 domain-containing protein [Planctomyces sp.]|nr:DUF202 domain-containing protein [Planctomyces sp.]